MSDPAEDEEGEVWLVAMIRTLRVAAQECDDLALMLAQARERRDTAALQLVDAGMTWRDVASIAGFANPYIAALKRRADRAPVPASGGAANTEDKR